MINILHDLDSFFFGFELHGASSSSTHAILSSIWGNTAKMPFKQKRKKTRERNSINQRAKEEEEKFQIPITFYAMVKDGNVNEKWMD